MKIPSLLQISTGLSSHSLHLQLDLVGDLYFIALVLPIGELVLVELLFEFGLHIRDFLVIGSPLVDELLGSILGC